MCGHRVAQAHIELASHPRSERLEMRLRRSRRRNQRDRERHAQYERVLDGRRTADPGETNLPLLSSSDAQPMPIL